MSSKAYPLSTFRNALIGMRVIIDGKPVFTYEKIAEKMGDNKFYPWRIVDDPDYKPPVSKRRKWGICLDPRPRRVAIHCSDMQSAANTITDNLDAEKVDELVVLLEERSNHV